jgi:hypothetical protein
MLSNQEIITVGGKEYTLTLTRKGISAIEKYTSLSKKKDEFKKNEQNSIKYVDEIKENEDPFADLNDEEQEKKIDESLELMKRVLWICLWDAHKMSIEQVRELLVQIIDENKYEELNNVIERLVSNINKQPSEYLKNMKALKAQK